MSCSWSGGRVVSPEFDSAVESFREFLRQQGVSDSIRWIFRDAIISGRCTGSRRSANRRIYIDETHIVDESLIRPFYQRGVERGLGISLRVLCLTDRSAICYVEIPENEAESQCLMMGPLKCALPDPCPVAILIRSPWIASLLRLVIRMPANSWFASIVPSRPERDD